MRSAKYYENNSAKNAARQLQQRKDAAEAVSLRETNQELQQQLESLTAEKQKLADDIEKQQKIIVMQADLIASLQKQLLPKKVRTNLETRREILLMIGNCSDKSPNFIRQAITAFNTNVAVHTVQGWMRTEDSITDRKFSNSQRRITQRPHLLLEQKVFADIQQMGSNGVVKVDVHYDDILSIAQFYLPECWREMPARYTNFFTNRSWVYRFCKSAGLKSRKICGERSANMPSQEEMNAFVLRVKDFAAENNVDWSNVFSADEVGYYPKRRCRLSMVPKDIPTPAMCSELTDTTKRFTALFCCSFTGEVRTPFIIGKSVAKASNTFLPNYKNSGLDYAANKSTFMCRKLFSAWLTKLDNEMRAENRKILLLIDNFSGHWGENQQPLDQHLRLENVKIFYLPPNCTSVLQLLDVGVNRSIKAAYRRAYGRWKLKNRYDNKKRRHYFNVFFSHIKEALAVDRKKMVTKIAKKLYKF